jgi:hypothetical protein
MCASQTDPFDFVRRRRRRRGLLKMSVEIMKGGFKLGHVTPFYVICLVIAKAKRSESTPTFARCRPQTFFCKMAEKFNFSNFGTVYLAS